MAVKRLEVLNLIAIRIGIDRHNARCPEPPEAILLNPIDFDLLGYRRIWGVPVIADDSVSVRRCRIQCDGSAEGIEEELADYLGGSALE